MHASIALAAGCSALSSQAMLPPAQHSSEVQTLLAQPRSRAVQRCVRGICARLTPARIPNMQVRQKCGTVNAEFVCKADTDLSPDHAGASEVWDSECWQRVQGHSQGV